MPVTFVKLLLIVNKSELKVIFWETSIIASQYFERHLLVFSKNLRRLAKICFFY